MTTTRKTTARKATHLGHCQVCGCQQKLPGGVLSKHGYTTKWGFFAGTCTGSGSLPIELSKDLLDGAVAYAENRIKVLTHEANAVRNELSYCWVHEYREARSRHESSGYFWRMLQISEIQPDSIGRPSYLNSRGRACELGGYDWELVATHGRLIANILECNKRRAEALMREVAQVEQYREWQKERIAKWAPAELQPIK